VREIIMHTIAATKRLPARALLSALLPTLLAAGCAWHKPPHRDVLAISDEGAVADPDDPATLMDDSVKFFDAHTGARLPGLGVRPNTGLVGPAGMLFPDGPWHGLLVVNQNQYQPYPGEVRHYDPGGRRLPDYVPATARNAPWAPRGAIVVDNKDGSRTLFVADQGDQAVRGRLLAYTLRGGQVVNRDNPVNLDPRLRNADGSEQEYHPRAAVLGPDGLLYVSQFGVVAGLPAPGCGGSVLRFDPRRLRFLDVVIENPSLCRDNVNDLHRPEGLVFSPDGDLYVTSFRQRSFVPGDVVDPNDNDRILIIDRTCLGLRHGPGGARHCHAPPQRIDLWRPRSGQARAYAQALLFGPGGDLYVPIASSGEVRRYDVRARRYTIFIRAGSPGGPVTPQYLSFGRTDPATLAYEERGHR
jgi:hypothetical protein